MTQAELTKYNIGKNLDDLMNLDPRGYGVCRILYPAAREYMKATISMRFAEELLSKIKPDSLVYILTGFVLLPFGKAEMDGIIGSVLLARALVKCGAKPVLVIPEDNLEAAKKLSAVAGIHCYTDIADVIKYPISMAAITFTKDAEKAEEQTARMLEHGMPAAVVAIEAPGAMKKAYITMPRVLMFPVWRQNQISCLKSSSVWAYRPLPLGTSAMKLVWEPYASSF